jgi:hypothetical protein
MTGFLSFGQVNAGIRGFKEAEGLRRPLHHTVDDACIDMRGDIGVYAERI